MEQELELSNIIDDLLHTGLLDEFGQPQPSSYTENGKLPEVNTEERQIPPTAAAAIPAETSSTLTDSFAHSTNVSNVFPVVQGNSVRYGQDAPKDRDTIQENGDAKIEEIHSVEAANEIIEIEAAHAPEPEPQPSTSTGSGSSRPSRRKAALGNRVFAEPAAELDEEPEVEIVGEVAAAAVPKKRGRKKGNASTSSGEPPAKTPRVRKREKTTKMHELDPILNPDCKDAGYQKWRRDLANDRFNFFVTDHQKLREHVYKLEEDRDLNYVPRAQYNEVSGILEGLLNQSLVLVPDSEEGDAGGNVGMEEPNGQNLDPEPDAGVDTVVGDELEGEDTEGGEPE